MLTIIAAVGQNNELGKKGGLCFHLKKDLAFFKETTMGHKIVMGYRTYASLPKRLMGREYYVVTTSSDGLPEWITPVFDQEAFFAEHAKDDEEIFVIGGGATYAAALPYCSKLILTRVMGTDSEADTFFPSIGDEWNLSSAQELGYDGDYDCRRETYTNSLA